MSEKKGFITSLDFVALLVKNLEASKKFWIEPIAQDPARRDCF